MTRAGQCWRLQVGRPSRRGGEVEAEGMEKRRRTRKVGWRRGREVPSATDEAGKHLLVKLPCLDTTGTAWRCGMGAWGDPLFLADTEKKAAQSPEVLPCSGSTLDTTRSPSSCHTPGEEGRLWAQPNPFTHSRLSKPHQQDT